MAIADAGSRFTAVNIGAFGRSNDSGVLKNSVIGQRLYSGDFSFPTP